MIGSFMDKKQLIQDIQNQMIQKISRAIEEAKQQLAEVQ